MPTTAFNGYSFSFHGIGCYFEFDNGHIDIDFGPDDRCDGFDSWRLSDFFEATSKNYSFSLSENEIEDMLKIFLVEKIVFAPEWYPGTDLLYLTEKE